MIRRFAIVFAIIVLTTLACGLFGGKDGEEPSSENASTETQEVAGAMEQTEMPPDIEPTERVDTPLATEPPKKSDKDIPISTKQPGGERKPTQVAPPTTPDEGLPVGITEVFYPYQVAEYSRGVEISVIEFRAYELSIGANRFIGIIQNTGDVDLYSMSVYIFYLDGSGEVIGSDHESSGPRDFQIGEKNVFGVLDLDGIPDGVENLLIAFDGIERWEGINDTQNFEIISVDDETVPDNLYEKVHNFNVGFRNETENNVARIRIIAILYNKNNRMIGYGSSWDEWGNEELPPGELGEISFSCRVVYGIVDHYELIIEGDLIIEY